MKLNMPSINIYETIEYRLPLIVNFALTVKE